VLREAIVEGCGLPVLGAIPRLPQDLFPQRHLGLTPPEEHDQAARAIEQVAGVAQRHLDLEALERLAREAPLLESCGSAPAVQDGPPPDLARIGVFRDAAFQFYYPENLEALAREGGRVIEVSPLGDSGLPDVDALYVGGGFPETLAPALAENRPFLKSLRQAVEKGLPVYAECGGAVFLGQELTFEQKRYPMAAVLPVAFAFGAKPRGHGYTVLETVQGNPYYSVGESLRGHEFHYTYMQPSAARDLTFAFRVRRGYGFDGQRDGLCYRNVLASYMHVHALGTESWAPSLVRAAVRYRSLAATTDRLEESTTRAFASH
jgi:cobyrinic acid a,c-diamide synthase